MDLEEHEPFLRAIREAPDDFEPYGVYSDWLAERGDPRGEFMQLQWRLDDPNLIGDARKKAREAETQLLEQHKNEWLAELAPDVTENVLPGNVNWVRNPYEYRFSKGLLESLKIEYLLPAFAVKLCSSSFASMLRRLEIVNLPRGEELVEEFDEYQSENWDWDDCPSLDALVTGHFGNLRELIISEGDYGCHIIAPNVHKLVENAPRLEVLRVEAHEIETNELFQTKMPQLQSLTINHITEYPTELLGRNDSLEKLESITFQPHAIEYGEEIGYLALEDIVAICRSPHLTRLKHLHLQCTDFGDAGIDEIVNSGILRRLETLKLPSGATTDAGARVLANADLDNLKRLDLTNNYLTPEGIALLNAKDVSFLAGSQNDPSSGERAHLYDGDYE